MLKMQQIKKIEKTLYSCGDRNSAFVFLEDLSKHLKSNLNKQTIIEVQREYIRHFKQNISKINEYISSNLVYKTAADDEFYSEVICKKKLIEHSILFLKSNDFIEDSFEDEADSLIYSLIKKSKNKLSSYSLENYRFGFHHIFIRFGEYLKYSSTIHEEFSKEMISFIKNNIDKYSDKIKPHLRLILHSLIIHCGEEIDYNRMVFEENEGLQFSESEREKLIVIGDILSFDKEYFKNRLLSIKRSPGYMDKKETILSHSLDSEILDAELAEFAGKLSKNNSYYFSRRIIERGDLDTEEISAYSRAVIMQSKNLEVYQTLYKVLTKSDFVMCLPIFSQYFNINDYFRRCCEKKLLSFQNQ